jgi:hypothetical protein
MTVHINANSNFHLSPIDLLDNIPPEGQGGGDGPEPGPGDTPTYAPEYLSAGAMLAYCGTQLQQIDSQIQKIFAEQQKQNLEQQVINQALQVLQGCADGTLDKNGKSADNAEQCRAMEKALEKAISTIEQIDPNAPCLQQLKQIHDNIMATGTGDKDPQMAHGYYVGPNDGNPTPDNNISSTEMANFINALQNVGSGLNSDAQLRMINIQSLVSQQQTAVELTTNIMQSLNDAQKKVVENIR